MVPVDHEATTQPYRPVTKKARHGVAAGSGGPLPQERQADLEYELTTQDEEQTERWDRRQWAK